MSLTERHRLAQSRIGAGTVLAMHRIWRLLDPDDLDGTFADWALAAAGIITTRRAMSARTAASYLAVAKAEAVGLQSPLRPILAETANAEAVTTSLLVTGPVSIKRAMSAGTLLTQALKNAESSSSAAAMRHVLDGGRETVMQTLRADKEARGWQRVASGKACQFCASLDGKFHRDDTADFPAHDGCSCSQEPVWH